MEKQIDDAKNIDENFDTILEMTSGMPFSTKRSEWDKMSRISSENLIEVGATAKMARQKANVAKVTAYKAATQVKRNRRGKQHVTVIEHANEANAHTDRIKAEAHLAEAKHVIAEQGDNDFHLIYERLCEK